MTKSQTPRYITVVHKTEYNNHQHNFGFVYEESYHSQALRNLGQIASDPELHFTWTDAARVSEEMRKQFWELKLPTATKDDHKDDWHRR